MAQHVLPEQGLHIASCFVHAIFLIVSVYHAAFSHRNAIRVPLLKYDLPKHLILSLRIGVAIVLTAVTFGEFVYQLDNRIYPSPDTSFTLFYADQVLTFLAWAANVWLIVLLAKNRAFVYFSLMDHFLTVIPWLFVVAIEALRFDQYVVKHVKSSSEQLTTTVILAASLVYFLTLAAIIIVDGLRKYGRCLNKYEQLGPEDVEDASAVSRGSYPEIDTQPAGTATTSTTVVEHTVTVHRQQDESDEVS